MARPIPRRKLLAGGAAALGAAAATAVPWGGPEVGAAPTSASLLALSPPVRQYSGGGPGTGQRVAEYLDGPAAGKTVTLLHLPAGTSGLVTKLWLAGGTPALFDAVLRITADQASAPQVRQDLGVLFIASQLESAPGGAYTAWTQNMAVGMEVAGIYTSGYATLAFPIPFSNGLTIALRAAGGSLSGTSVFFRAEYLSVPAEEVPAQRLHSVGVTQLDSVNLPPTANLQLADLKGPGWAVYFSQVSTGSADRSVLERDMGWYIDGDIPPVADGAVTTPTGPSKQGDPPGGPGIGAPSIMSSGTEDFFYSGWYWLSATSPTSSPHSAMMLDGQTVANVYSAAVDLMAANGGYYFDESLQLWRLTESRVTSAENYAWCLLAYLGS